MPGEADGAIAIVAMAARLPDAPDAETFWRNSLSGLVSIHAHGREEMIASGVPPADVDRQGYVAAKGVVADATRFDAYLFGYSPAEAAVIDPQQRVFLECCREAFDRAAIDPRRFRGQTGVYAGQFLSTYLLNNLATRPDVVERMGVATVFQGNTVDQLATRVAYKLDLRGPAVTVQSACSTSLVAVHLACRALASYECDLALAGGVTLTFPQLAGYASADGGIVSPDGRCRPFDAAANGTVFSDGVGVVALRRLNDALEDGDPIRAVIRGSAVTNDGNGKVAYSAPSVDGQTRAIVEAIAFAGVAPGSIGFVETHGTGTPVGDLIEVQALRDAFGVAEGGNRVALGAAKANIGHLDAAAGVVGLIRAAFVVERGVIPPLASFSELNPALPLAGTPFYVPTEARPWPQAAGPRRASVSAFGVGGTNAHVVLEQPPERTRSSSAQRRRLVPLSAKTRSALMTTCERIATAVEATPSISAASLQATLALGRPAMEWRTNAVVSGEGAAAALRHAAVRSRRATARDVVFLFPGHGAADVRLDRSLYEAHASFRAAFEEVASCARRRLGIDAAALLFGDGGTQPRETCGSQLTAFATSYALARALEHDGVNPVAMIGHGAGEYAAAVLAEILSVDDALKILVARAETDTASNALADVLSTVRLHPARRTIVSTVSGRVMAPLEAANSAYWLRHAREPVRFREAVAAAASSDRVFVEMGPGRQLTRSAREVLGTATPAFAMLEPRSLPDSYGAFLGGLGRLWSTGIDLRWHDLIESAATRVELPPHPFEGEEHFLTAGHHRVEGSLTVSPSAGSSERWLGVPTFRHAPGRIASRLDERRRRWLLYVPRAGAFEDLVEYLEAHGQVVTRVAPGDELGRLTRGVYTMRFDDAEQTASLFQQLRALVRMPNVILHLTATGAESASRDDLSFGPFLALARAFPAESAATELRLGVVTRGVFDVVGTETLVPHAARVIGPALVLPQELGRFAVRHVDLGDGADDVQRPDVERVVAHVLGNESEPLAVRYGRAYEPDVVPVVAGPDAAVIRDGCVYAVVGGLGGVGAALTEHLVRERGATVVVIGRREFPPRERWDSLEDFALRAAVRRVREIEAGARGRVELASADVRDAARLATVLREASAFGTLRGIVHAAGIAGGDAMVHDTLDRAQNVMSVKVEGALAIQRALSETGLDANVDFVALCSSTAALVGGRGQWSYAAANAYLDAFAARQARLGGCRWVSIDWDTFDAGMAARDAEKTSPALRELRANVVLDVAQAGVAFEYALAVGEPVVVVSRLVDVGLSRARALFARANADDAAERHARPDIDVPFVAPRTELERRIAEIWSDVLAVDDPGVHDSFTDLGGHSLLAVQLAARMRESFDVDVTLGMLFENDSVMAMAIEIERLILAELSEATPGS